MNTKSIDKELLLLKSKITALEELLKVYEIAAREQSQKLEQTMNKSHNQVHQLAEAEKTLARQTIALEYSNAELRQFASAASHDLQEPLRMVASYVKLLFARSQILQGDSEACEFMSYIVDGVTRMQVLIKDLLIYSKVGVLHNDFTPVDCEFILEQAVWNLKVAIEESGALVTRGTLPVILSSETQMIQLFQNLIGNAIKFCKNKKPEIRIEAERRPGKWLFSVCDNGIGIEPGNLSRIFDIFQRLHTRDEYPGTGIGLAICKKIVEGHGGDLWVESRFGSGSTFYFTIPCN